MPAADTRAGVSVVIPAYNYAAFLPRAIDSVLRQDHVPLEIVVVDDGSTDNTAEIVAGYGDKVRYVYQKNAGLPAARNTGVRHARYDFIGFLDADDEWVPSMLRKSMEAFARLPADYGIVASLVQCVDVQGNPVPQKWIFPKYDREVTCREILLQTRFSPSAVVARRDALEQAGMFDETLRSSEDRDMWIRIGAKRKIFVIDERLVLLRKHPNSMSRNADRMKANVRRVLLKAYRDQLVPRSDVFFWLKAFSFHYFQAAWVYQDQGRSAEALRNLVLSLLLWPYYHHPQQFNEPALFRVASLARFTRGLFQRSGGA